MLREIRILFVKNLKYFVSGTAPDAAEQPDCENWQDCRIQSWAALCDLHHAGVEDKCDEPNAETRINIHDFLIIFAQIRF